MYFFNKLLLELFGGNKFLCIFAALFEKVKQIEQWIH
jgi:hypothetical protein